MTFLLGLLYFRLGQSRELLCIIGSGFFNRLDAVVQQNSVKATNRTRSTDSDEEQSLTGLCIHLFPREGKQQPLHWLSDAGTNKTLR